MTKKVLQSYLKNEIIQLRASVTAYNKIQSKESKESFRDTFKQIRKIAKMHEFNAICADIISSTFKSEIVFYRDDVKKFIIKF